MIMVNNTSNRTKGTEETKTMQVTVENLKHNCCPQGDVGRDPTRSTSRGCYRKGMF